MTKLMHFILNTTVYCGISREGEGLGMLEGVENQQKMGITVTLVLNFLLFLCNILQLGSGHLIGWLHGYVFSHPDACCELDRLILSCELEIYQKQH